MARVHKPRRKAETFDEHWEDVCFLQRLQKALWALGELGVPSTPKEVATCINSRTPYHWGGPGCAKYFRTHFAAEPAAGSPYFVRTEAAVPKSRHFRSYRYTLTELGKRLLERMRNGADKPVPKPKPTDGSFPMNMAMRDDPWPAGDAGTWRPCPVCHLGWRPWAGSYLPCHGRCLFTAKAQNRMLTGTLITRELAEQLGVTQSVISASIAAATGPARASPQAQEGVGRGKASAAGEGWLALRYCWGNVLLVASRTEGRPGCREVLVDRGGLGSAHKGASGWLR